MSLTEEKLKYIEIAVAALFKLHKFKKRRLRWKRERNGITEIFEIRKSDWKPEDRITVFFRLGLSKYQAKNVDGSARKVSLTTRQIFASTDKKQLAREIIAEIETVGFPWFELAEKSFDLKEKASEIFDYVVPRVAALLKEAGFKRKGLLWVRERGKITNLFGMILLGKNISTKYISFPVGIFDLDFYIKKYNGSPDTTPRISLCEKRYRKTLSELKGRKKGDYEITSSTNQRKLTILVIDNIKWKALPWFEQKIKLK